MWRNLKSREFAKPMCAPAANAKGRNHLPTESSGAPYDVRRVVLEHPYQSRPVLALAQSLAGRLGLNETIENVSRLSSGVDRLMGQNNEATESCNDQDTY